MTKKIDNTTIGGRIKQCRLRIGMTQEELAERLHSTKPLISQYENNKVDIKGSIILELAIILETSTGYLLNNECRANDMDEVEKEMFALLKNMKSENLRKVALEQLRTLTSIEK